MVSVRLYKQRFVLWLVSFLCASSLGGVALVLYQRELVVRWRSLETAQNRGFCCQEIGLSRNLCDSG